MGFNFSNKSIAYNPFLGCLEVLLSYITYKIMQYGQEKMLLNRLKTQLSQVQTNLTTLEVLVFKVMATDEDGKLAYEREKITTKTNGSASGTEG